MIATRVALLETAEYIVADEFRSTPGERVNVGLSPEEPAFVIALRPVVSGRIFSRSMWLDRRRAATTQQLHILQMGALSLMVQDVYDVRSPYSVVVLADGSQERVACSMGIEFGVVRTIAEMRRILAAGEPPGRSVGGGEVPGLLLIRCAGTRGATGTPINGAVPASDAPVDHPKYEVIVR